MNGFDYCEVNWFMFQSSGAAVWRHKKQLWMRIWKVLLWGMRLAICWYLTVWKMIFSSESMELKSRSAHTIHSLNEVPSHNLNRTATTYFKWKAVIFRRYHRTTVDVTRVTTVSNILKAASFVRYDMTDTQNSPWHPSHSCFHLFCQLGSEISSGFGLLMLNTFKFEVRSTWIENCGEETISPTVKRE